MSGPKPAWLTELEAGSPAPVYFFWGDDSGAIDHALREVRDAFSRPPLGMAGMESFNSERFDAAYTSTVARVLEACAQMPLGAAHRYVEVLQPENFASQLVRGQKSEDLQSSPVEAIEALIAYMADPNPATTLVLCCPGIAGTTRFVKAAKKQPGVVEHRFVVPTAADASEELRRRAQHLGHEVESEAARAIIDAVGPARSDWDSALQRCIEHAGGRVVTLRDVQAVVARTREQDVFELTQAIADRDLPQALIVLDAAFGNSGGDTGTALRLHALLIWQLRRLLVAGHSADPARAVGAPAFVAHRLQDQARRFGKAALCRAMRGLESLDGDLKGSSYIAGASPRMALQRWVLDTCAVR